MDTIPPYSDCIVFEHWSLCNVSEHLANRSDLLSIYSKGKVVYIMYHIQLH